ncbi:hypothetical protein [Ideonella sp.]|uniref:hypothetical protein n=1 Tax=Ideonella sp. TaxID=1929293 RepID=UPI002B45E90A|nr:hypothetical protein [Ideonella sp.]HJV67710.1 hypothetical protein [Ideonella sp.]
MISTLAIPVSLAGSTVIYNVWAAKRSDAESRLRLYTELVNKREEADTNLRREIFAKLMEKYLDPGQKDLDRRLAVLELLTQNFNESLNLSPLFWQLERQIVDEGGKRAPAFRAQLMRIADTVKQRQLDVLQVYGGGGEADPVFKLPADKPILDRDLTLELPSSDGAKRRIGCHFIVEALEPDEASHSVQVRVQSMPLERRAAQGVHVDDSPSCVGGFSRQWMFSVDPFDFPFVNYTRMSADERFAIFFSPHEGGLYSFKFVYFPSSLGGVRDKPFIDDVMNKLRSASK